MDNGLIKFIEFPELTFEEERHIYRLNGVQIPSVSAIMRPLTDAYYDGIDEDMLNAAARRGTAVHHAIETFIQFGIDDIAPEHEGYYQAFRTWWDYREPWITEATASERQVYHKILRYAGTTDLIFQTYNGELALADFKTSTTIVEMLAKVQVYAYKRAWESHAVKINECQVVHLRKDGSCQTWTLPDQNQEAYEEFAALLTHYNYLNRHSQ